MTTARNCLVRPILALFLLSVADAHAGPGPGLQPGEPLELAVAPFLPAATLVQNYQPLRNFLEQRLQRPVIIVSAPNYETYYRRILRREQPVIIAVANIAYLAQAESGYVPILKPAVYTRPVLVIAKTAKSFRASEFRGQSIALPDRFAIVAMQAEQMLRESGLDPEKDVRLTHKPTHSAAVNHVLAGEAAAAIVSDRALLQMPAATQAGVRVIQTWEKGAAPGVVYLASPDLPRQQVAQLTQAILTFVRETPEGREFINKLGYGSLVPATKQDLEPLAPYGEMFKEAIVRLNEKEKSE